jgi:hypothetical protein
VYRCTPNTSTRYYSSSWYMKGEVKAEMVKEIFEHQYAAPSDSTKDYQDTIYGQAGFRVGIGSRPIIAKKTKRTRAESGTPAGREQSGKKQWQGELSESGVQGPTQPRLTDRARGRQAKVRKKELDAENKAKEKDKKQEKVDKDKRTREREVANLRNFFVGPIAIGITPRTDG